MARSNVMKIVSSLLYIWLTVGSVSAVDTRSEATGSPLPERQYGSYEYDEDVHDLVRRQTSSQIYVTTGASGGTYTNGFPPVRQEIRDLEKNNASWNLYILALDLLQYTNQSQMLSWYQIAGIHGRPFLPYDNVQAASGDSNNGYCTHVSILFPTWHRPYLALYEQVLYKLAQQIANMYPSSTKQEYVDAAKNFRIPYWDWAKAPPQGQTVLPDSVGGSAYVDVDGPAGTQRIANPLYQYQFNPLNSTELPDSPFNSWPVTLRYPTSSSSTAQSQNSAMGQMLNSSASSFRSRLYNLFTNYPNYSHFSNEAWIPYNNNQNYDSIESLHDQIHGLTGYGGHMSYIDYSAFDPIFFLHHAMIDRCFALWQILYPNSWVTPQSAEYSTYTSSAGQYQTSLSNLTPFYSNASGKFWNSDTARRTSTFGYMYPETSNVTGGSSTSNIQNNVKIAINTLYGSGISSSSSSKRDMYTPICWSGNEAECAASEEPHSHSRHRRHFSIKDSTFRALSTSRQEWILNIQVAKLALNGPFFIYIFIGDFSNDPADWSLDPNQVATHAIFTPASPSTCAGCSMDKLVTGTIPLTERLQRDVDAGLLKSLSPSDVNPYLKSKLAWRVARVNGTYVPNDEVPSLSTSVVSSVVEQPAADNLFPVWGPFSLQLNLTALGFLSNL